MKHASPAKPRWACCDVTEKSVYYIVLLFPFPDMLFFCVNSNVCALLLLHDLLVTTGPRVLHLVHLPIARKN